MIEIYSKCLQSWLIHYVVDLCPSVTSRQTAGWIHHFHWLQATIFLRLPVICLQLLQKLVLLEDDRGRLSQMDRNGLESHSLKITNCSCFAGIWDGRTCDTEGRDLEEGLICWTSCEIICLLPYIQHRHLDADQGTHAREPGGQAGLRHSQLSIRICNQTLSE